MRPTLTELLIRDETITSLGQTYTFAVHHSGETTSLCDLICSTAEIAFHPGTSGTYLVLFHPPVDRRNVTVHTKDG